MHRLALALVVIVLPACAAQPAGSPSSVAGATPPDAPIACTPPRPEVCTMVYAPVCATLANEPAPAQYSSPCNACADDRVVAYREGACE